MPYIYFVGPLEYKIDLKFLLPIPFAVLALIHIPLHVMFFKCTTSLPLQQNHVSCQPCNPFLGLVSGLILYGYFFKHLEVLYALQINAYTFPKLEHVHCVMFLFALVMPIFFTDEKKRRRNK